MRDESKKGSSGWIVLENGHEKTDSYDLIKQTLAQLKQKHTFIVLLQKGYQSASTVLISFDNQSLIIDKPVDWPDLKNIRVVFKDETKVWNYFTVSIAEAAQDTLKTDFPIELFRQQRREHFRVSVPANITGTFLHNKKEYKNVVIGNLSIGGVMFCLPASAHSLAFNELETITNISMNIPTLKSNAGKKSFPYTGPGQDEGLVISKGIVVRSFYDKAQKKICLGLKFHLRPKEEETLLQYIRQLELEELRKGIMQT